MDRMVRLLGAAALAASAAAQNSGWTADQVNATMCYWSQLRAAVLRDTVYLDGGHLWWKPGLESGNYGAPTQDGNPLGLIYTLNFSRPFTTSANISSVFGTLSKAPSGGAANNFAPSFQDGAILANDHEFFLYGGLLPRTDAFQPPRADDVLGYQGYQYGVQKDGFRPGFVNARLPDGLTRYLAYGAAANAPSENKAWYFGGLRSPLSGPIYYPAPNASQAATNVSDTLITLDLTTQQREQWANASLPDNIEGRAGAELVWVPVGAQGILVALGGVVFPEWVNPSHKSSDEAASNAKSPEFIKTVDIFDVASGNWYKQPTSGGPTTALARGCAVVATAQDRSSFNIYWYGGYDGLHPSQPFSDDVWVLSLPSFKWTKLYTGTASHGRAGHRCVMPYPDQMMVIGGSSALSGTVPTCLDGGLVQIFNISSGKWLEMYDPATWSEYSVPEAVYASVGGSATGGATATTAWANPSLASVFASAYPTSKLTAYYPYSPDGPGSNFPRPNVTNNNSGTPAWVGGVIGGAVALVLFAAVIGFLMWRRRRRQRSTGRTEYTDDSGSRIMNWIKGQPSDTTKAMTVTSEETGATLDDTAVASSGRTGQGSYNYNQSTGTTQTSSWTGGFGTPQMAQVPVEMHDTSVIAELMDTSSRAELSPVAAAAGAHHSRQHSHRHHRQHGSGQYQQTRFSDTLPPTFHPGSVMPPDMGPSRSVSNATAAGGGGVSASRSRRITSGVSAMSETDRGHLRGISDATVSSAGSASVSPGSTHQQQQQQRISSPPPMSPASETSGTPLAGGIEAGGVSPPTADSGSGGAGDYVSYRPTVAAGVGTGARTDSPSRGPRRSVFREHDEDMNGSGGGGGTSDHPPPPPFLGR